ncbi:MAG: dihydrofolate reductase family protein [Rikenellaceae bacterium]
MPITLSVATSADGYIDDNSSSRLVLSTAEDWAEVYTLRAEADAIVIGAETLRRDNPRLTLKSEELVQRRIAAGRTPEPHKVIISRSAYIDPALRLFGSTYRNIIVFSQVARPELEAVAEVIVEPAISAALVVSELDKRGLHNIFVEGGARILRMFLNEKIAHTLRLAVNPTIAVSDSAAPRFELPKRFAPLSSEQRDLGGMEVTTFTLQHSAKSEDVALLTRAIELSRSCRPSATSYCVGAVVVTAQGEIFEGYTHETSPTHHAEQEAIKKAEAAGAQLAGAVMYSSMEPCSVRSSEPESCSQIIIRHRFSRAVFALYEPSCFVVCHGARNMRLAGVEVECIAELGELVRQVNSHLDF